MPNKISNAVIPLPKPKIKEKQKLKKKKGSENNKFAISKFYIRHGAQLGF